MENKYIEPEIKIIINTDDVICTSGGGGDIVLPDDEWET